MSVFKCKMCGGDLEIHEGSAVCKCEYCGSMQTIPALGSEKKTNLFNRANRLRMNSEFDKAAAVYASITAEFPTEAEAYWGQCLCKYGIEYVDDPLTGNRIPTCHRTLASSILEDDDYVYAVKYADYSARSLYASEAKRIDELQQDILQIVKNEAPYDVFICYKETDENGDRTEDSVIAHDIYDSLTDKGLKVFFSRITLEDKLGREYEPYIYAALLSARVMVVVGTSFENIDAPWVKNEWSRFIEIMKSDRSKTLVPCYKGIEISEMPKAFQRLQCQDLSKLGWIQDLTRGVVKLCGKEPQKAVKTDADIEKDQTINPVHTSNPDTKAEKAPSPVPAQAGKSEKEKTMNPAAASKKVVNRKGPEEHKVNIKTTLGHTVATIFHMIFIMFLSISIVAFSPSNSSVLVPLGLLVALITVVFVWKYDRKKSTGRVLLDIVFCFAALIAWANAVGHIDLYTGIIGTWVFIILSIRF